MTAPNLSPAKIAAALALATSMIASFEGLRLHVYPDVGNVPTYCYGHADRNVDPKAKFTPGQCEVLLEADAQSHQGGVLACVTRPLPVETLAAFDSFVYNVGVKSFCGSSLARKAQAGDIVGACNELPRWVMAAGKRQPGLVRRRAAERTLCLEGVK